MVKIDTSAIREGKYILQQSKSSAFHFHNDPKIIIQENVKNNLEIGDLVYLDQDGKYKKALASDTNKNISYVVGIVYDILGDDKFLLKVSEGHMMYRNPLPESWYAKVDGKVIENGVLYEKVPALLGKPLFLSDTEPGKMQRAPPISKKYIRLIGYRTEYGFYFKPEPYCDTGCENIYTASTVNIDVVDAPTSSGGIGAWAAGMFTLTRFDLSPVDNPIFYFASYISDPIPTEIDSIFGRIVLEITAFNQIIIHIMYDNPVFNEVFSWSLIKSDSTYGYTGMVTDDYNSAFAKDPKGPINILSWAI